MINYREGARVPSVQKNRSSSALQETALSSPCAIGDAEAECGLARGWHGMTIVEKLDALQAQLTEILDDLDTDQSDVYCAEPGIRPSH
jgi:hypothetical protein